MATTTEQAGAMSLKVTAANMFSGDTTGQRLGTIEYTKAFLCDADLPDIISMHGFLAAEEVVCANGEWHLGDPDDPFQGMGDSVVHDGINSDDMKLKTLVIISDDDNTTNIRIKIPATLGCPVLSPAGAYYDITPGGVFLFQDPSGAIALDRGVTDVLEIVASGSPTARVLMIFSE